MGRFLHGCCLLLSEVVRNETEVDPSKCISTVAIALSHAYSTLTEMPLIICTYSLNHITHIIIISLLVVRVHK